jgi:hypothetical protein
MGYWEQGEPVNGKTLLWGDQPADVLDDAIQEMIVNFLRDIRRLPTKEEIRRGLEFCLGGDYLPESEPGPEYTDAQLKVIDDLGYTAFGADLPYRGADERQRNAHSEVLHEVRKLQEPYVPELHFPDDVDPEELQ